jgi:Tfp pilus assembly protein PilN
MARRVNLIPRAERPRTKTDWGLLTLVGLFIIVLFALGFGYYTLSSSLDQRRQELADLEVQTAAVQEQVQALAQYERLAVKRENVQSVVQGIYSSRTLLSGVLNAVSLVVPDNAWFKTMELTASDPTLAAEGSASVAVAKANASGQINITGSTYSFEDVSRLLVRLQLVPSITGVQLSSANQNDSKAGSDVEVTGFSIGASILNKEPDGALPLTEVEVQAK